MRPSEQVGNGWIPASQPPAGRAARSAGRVQQPVGALPRQRPGGRADRRRRVWLGVRGGLGWRGRRQGSGPWRRIWLTGARFRRPLSLLLLLAAVWVTARVAAPPAPETVTVAVAGQDLPAGHQLSAGDLRFQQWPASLAPAQQASSHELAGATLATPVTAGEAITLARLLGPGLLAGQPPGSVAVTVRVADPASLALVRPGDRVDILAAASGWDQSSAPLPSPGAADDRQLPPGTLAQGGPGVRHLASSVLVLSTPAATANGADGDGEWAAAALGPATSGSPSDGSTTPASSGVLVLAVDGAAASRLAAAAPSQALSVVLLSR